MKPLIKKSWKSILVLLPLLCLFLADTREGIGKGYEINNLEKVRSSIIFQAGTTHDFGKTITNGGRVLSVTSLGKNMNEAFSKKSYLNAELIDFKDKYFTRVIGFDL